VAANDSLYCRQSYPIAWILASIVEPLEDAEEVVRILHIESGAIVTDEKYVPLAISSLDAQFDDCIFPFGGKFPSIA
jgi:hypothetical protein